MNIKSGCDMRKLPDTKFNQTSGKVSWKDCPTIDYRRRYKRGKYPGL